MKIAKYTGFGIVGFSLWMLAACSSDGSSSGSSGTSGTSGGGNCSCDVSENGASKNILCGASACVGASTYTCSATGDISSVAGCTAPANDGGPTKDSGGGGSTTFDCVGFSTSKCNTATEYCIITKQKRAAGYDTNSTCVPKPAGCSSCPCAITNAATADSNPKKFCTGGVTVTCGASDGELTVTCQN